MTATIRFIIERDGAPVLDQVIKRPALLPEAGQRFTSGDPPTVLECIECDGDKLVAKALPKQPVVTEDDAVQTMDELLGTTLPVVAQGIRLTTYHPTKDGSGKPTEVHVMLPMKLDLGETHMSLTAVMRLRSREMVQALIDGLIKHRDEVFGG